MTASANALMIVLCEHCSAAVAELYSTPGRPLVLTPLGLEYLEAVVEAVVASDRSTPHIRGAAPELLTRGPFDGGAGPAPVCGYVAATWCSGCRPTLLEHWGQAEPLVLAPAGVGLLADVVNEAWWGGEGEPSKALASLRAEMLEAIIWARRADAASGGRP